MCIECLRRYANWGTRTVLQYHSSWTVPRGYGENEHRRQEVDFKLWDCKPEMDLINKAFETMVEGDANGRGFQSVPTYLSPGILWYITNRLRDDVKIWNVRQLSLGMMMSEPHRLSWYELRKRQAVSSAQVPVPSSSQSICRVPIWR